MRAAFLAALLLPIGLQAAPLAPVIIHSNDVLGEIEPCGCRANPLGGMLRKEKLLRSHPNGLQLDAGDLFFSSSEIPESLKEQSRIQSQALARALKLTGLRAMVPGEKDFSLGTRFYLELTKQSGAVALAANLEWRPSKSAGWRPLLKPWAGFELSVQKNRTLKVAVLGLVGDSITLPADLRAADPVAAAARIVPQLRRKFDRIIVLTHQGLEADQQLAARVSGIDFIIGGHSQSFLQHPWTEGTVSIHQSSFRNQHVGIISIDPATLAAKSELVELSASLDSADTESSQVRPLLAETRKKIEAAALEARKKEELASARDGAPRPVKYQTFPQCAECHVRQFDFWRKTPHASAYEALVKAKAQSNLECLGCHSVGLGDREGYAGPKDIAQWNTHSPLPEWLAQLRDARSAESALEIVGRAKRIHATVQCENCHAPVRDHPFSMGSKHATVSTQTCLGCHTPARAPTWYNAERGGNGKLDEQKLASSLAKMSCPRDPL